MFPITRKDVVRWVLDNIVWFILILVILFFSAGIRGFAQWGIYRNILYHAVFVGILAIGEALCIISRELDLSVESVLGLATVVTAYLTGSPWGLSSVFSTAFSSSSSISAPSSSRCPAT